MENLEEQLLESSLKFNGKILSVKVDQVKLPDGNRSEREIVEHPGGVTVIPYNPRGKIVMIEQYRHAAGQVLLELPAGRLEAEEEPEIGGRRELQEETGYKAGEMIHLFDFYTTPGYSTECLNLFLARDLQQGEQQLETGEFLSLTEIAPEEIPDLVLSGKVKDSKTAVGLLAFLQYEQENISD